MTERYCIDPPPYRAPGFLILWFANKDDSAWQGWDIALGETEARELIGKRKAKGGTRIHVFRLEPADVASLNPDSIPAGWTQEDGAIKGLAHPKE
jgi:hypothetical protein